MIGLTQNLAFLPFIPQQGVSLAIYIFGAMAIGVIFLFMLTKVPVRYRKPIIVGVTFLMGWFYFLEFVIPGNSESASVRGRLKAAEQRLRVASHILNEAVVRNGSGQPAAVVQNSHKSVARAKEPLALALEDLKAAQSSIDGMRPEVERRFERETARLDASVVRNRLTEKMVERDEETGKVLNVHTRALKKEIGDFEAASSRVGTAISAIGEAQSVFSGAPGEGLEKAAGAVSGAAEMAVDARVALSENFLTPYKEPIANVVLVLGAFAVGLGVYSLLSIHGKGVLNRRPGWINGLAFYIAFVSMTAFGLLQKYASADAPLGTLSQSFYGILFSGVLASLQATMFSVIAFYIVSAAYRAFRIKSGEAAIMMVAAFLVMLSLVPFGVWLTSWLPREGWLAVFRLENIGSWILNVPNTAAQRGMAFGIGVGMLAMALRIWLSLERGSFFDKQA
ncbi:MAG: hypothetical protein HYX78_13530 [Armatimonadetes bacterium]|nr:hypothetical protein [Armatimonadota bacterium]